jgi:hypothetical protein
VDPYGKIRSTTDPQLNTIPCETASNHFLAATQKSPNPKLQNMIDQNVQSLHSSSASQPVSATSPVECSPQEPVKRTAETNHPANSIREHSELGTQHAHQKPTAETIDP